MKLKLLPLIGILLLCSGCPHDPYAGDLITKQPQVKDVAGTYIFEQQTISDTLKKEHTQNCQLILKPDSTFSAIGIPDFTGIFAFKFSGNITGKGKWHITSNGAVNNGSGGTKPVWGIALDSLSKNLQHMDFIGKTPPYKLIITYGDPDEADVMILSKIK